jgi:hypothetical protein
VLVLALRSGVLAMAAVSGDDNDVLASVTALTRKAALLSSQGHFARAAEKSAAAVAAAQSLQHPECLIVANLQLDESCWLSLHADACSAQADAKAAYQRIYSVILPAVMATLQRRKAAGTLLPGACRAHETTLFGHLQECRSDNPAYTPAFLADMGSLIGYVTYVGAAEIVMAGPLLQPMFHNNCVVSLPPLPEGQLAAQRALVLSALELVRQPRVLDTTCRLGGEAGLVDKCLTLVSTSAINSAQPSEWVQQLRVELRRVERSGVMQQRGMVPGLAKFDNDQAAARATGAADAVVHGLRRCALASCGAREAHVSHYKLCAACKTVVYCSKAHQAEDWPAHKCACKAARKEAAAAAAAAGGASGA